MKKIALVGAGLAIVFSAAFATTARAATDAELQAQIQSLLAMIANLQAQLAGATGGTTGGSTTTGTVTAMQFTENHKMGDKGGEVMNIQKFLNMDPATMVAASGPGSPGNETSYFGPATKAAVIKFQNKYASEILAPVGLSQGTGYWGASTRAKANALEIARAAASTGTGTDTGTTTPATSDLTVSAAAQPGNSLAPQSAANLPFTKFTLTAGSSDVTFDSVTVELTGLADKAAFASVVLLDENGNPVGLTKTLNSNDQATIGETTTIPAGMSKTFTVAGNMKSSLTTYAGQVAAFSVVSVNSSATVAGSLPITGAQHTINASLSIGSATVARGVEDPNSSKSKEIGTTNYKFQAVKITAGSAEDVRVKSVRWNQSGSASASDIANVTLTFGGNTYTPTVSGDYYTFNFGSGVVIAKGLSKEMVLSGDIVNGSSSTIIFDIRKDTDLVIMGETFGYGITPSASTTAAASDSSSQFTTSTPWFDGAAVTITGGSFNSVSKSNDAPAADVAEQVADTVLGAFTVDVKGEPITVETVKFAIDTTEASGTDVDADDITNITLVDQNGSVLAGPEDGSATAYTPTGGSAAEGSVSFSSVNFPVGATTVFVKGLLGSDFDSGDTVTIRVNPTDWSNATGDNTGDTITFPNALSSANTMTVQAGALTVTTLTQPAARSIVAGATDFVFATASLDAANSGEDIKVTAVTVTDTTVTGLGTEFDNVEIWADLTSADSPRGDVYETRISDTEQMTGTTGANTLSITLDPQVTVTKNTSVKVAVVGDISSAASSNDTHTVKISAATAVGLTSGATITPTVAGSGQTMTVATKGTLTLTIDSSTPVAGLILDDTTAEQTTAVFRLAADDVEDLDVDSIKLTSDGADDAVSKYVFYNGSTKLGEVAGGQDTAEVFFTDGTLTVPADGHVLVTVKAVMNNIDGTQVQNGDTVITTIASAGDVDTTGADSGAAVDSTQTSVDGNTLTMYEAYPTVAFDTTAVPSGSITLSASQRIAKIVVTNTGDQDITFQSGDSNLLSVQVQVVGDDTVANSTETITLKDQDGTTLDTGTITSASGTTQIDFNMSSVGATVGTTIPAGESRYFTIDADTSDLEDTGNLIQIWLDDTAADLTFGIDGSGAYAEGDMVFKGDIYGPSFTKE